MTIRLNDSVRNTLAEALGGAFDGGVLEIRTGSQPASAGTAASGTLLASISLPGSAFGAASGGAVAKAGTWSATAAASGTAGWARFRDTGDSVRMDGSVTGTAGGGDIELDDTGIVEGGTVTITNFTITQPANA